MHHLQSAQNIYHELETDEITKGLENENIVYIADGHSFYFLLGCAGRFENKVLVLNTNIDADQPLDNVAIVADSFDGFLQSIYYESDN